MKYITLFETAAAYNAATLDLPNVSLIEETMSVGFKPYVPETRVVCKYNVTDTSNPTALRTNFEQNIFKSMEIDGVMLDELVTEYTFDTVGEHTVKYELYDDTKLGNQIFVFGSNNLIKCIIPNSVTNIGNSVFQNCNSLTSVTIGNSVISIGERAFYGCSFTSIVIPDSVMYIGNSAFNGCRSLTSVTIGNSVTSIGNSAFMKCSNLTSITIPDSVTNISDYAFNECSNLTSIVSNAITAPTIQSYTFWNVKTGGTLTVPVGSTGYDIWMGTDDYYLGKYNWTKVEQ